MVLDLLFWVFYLSGDAFTSQALHATCCTFSKGTFGVLLPLSNMCSIFLGKPSGQVGGLLVLLRRSLTALGMGALRFKS